jgi:hypothetical protein
LRSCLQPACGEALSPICLLIFLVFLGRLYVCSLKVGQHVVQISTSRKYWTLARPRMLNILHARQQHVHSLGGPLIERCIIITRMTRLRSAERLGPSRITDICNPLEGVKPFFPVKAILLAMHSRVAHVHVGPASTSRKLHAIQGMDLHPGRRRSEHV